MPLKTGNWWIKMSSSPELFGFEPDDEGNINFLTIQSDYKPTSFEEYQELFAELVKVAVVNPGFMPIMTFPDMPPPPVIEDEEDET